uniref:Uncharacterized protein n=1 Tax=Arundo donax TaxID=35708 RepID=A0A0A9ATE2_ARUDO
MTHLVRLGSQKCKIRVWRPR